MKLFCQVARKHHDQFVLQAKVGEILVPIFSEQQARIASLEAALGALASVAEMCDSWESFPSGALEDAYAALPEDK
jgi:hypothetical protein